ncbi:uncharacterized protein [Drosophila kikkawai]|uniref:Uncharacterized protein n=1 Tax=Drosophila kikkawai TaxID=30033 RepID=A0A6P4JMR5_DROKI|nr:uncharacterized protein LOC108084361 [Drosophila kikkawai]
MKKRLVPESRKKESHLEFTTQDKVEIAAKDYGLMRTTNKAQTPYPHVDPGVDANLLKARLSMRRHFEFRKSVISNMSDNNSERFSTKDRMSGYDFKNNKPTRVSSQKSVHMGSQITNLNYKNLLSTGTPHPVKSVALNVKALSTRLIEVNLHHPESGSPSPEERPRTRRKKVMLRDASTVIMIQPDTTLDCERLSDVSMRVTRLDYSVPNSRMSVDSLASFAERRRLFDEGEYTIARKGKKMSDTMMAATTYDKRLPDHTTMFAKKAKEEIERYIKAQGLIKTSHDHWKWARHFDVKTPESSSDSEKPTVDDIYRDMRHQKSNIQTKPK